MWVIVLQVELSCIFQNHLHLVVVAVYRVTDVLDDASREVVQQGHVLHAALRPDYIKQSFLEMIIAGCPQEVFDRLHRAIDLNGHHQSSPESVSGNNMTLLMGGLRIRHWRSMK